MQLRHLATFFLALVAFSLAAYAAETKPAAVHYSIVDRIPGRGTIWDYLTVDAVARRLYIAQNGVSVLDLNTNKFTPQLVAGGLTHGVLLLGNGLIAVADSGPHTVSIFEGATGKVRATLHMPRSSAVKGLPRDPDALVLESKTGLIVAVNSDSRELVLIDPKKPSIVGTIPVKGSPHAAPAPGTGLVGGLEFAVADGMGTVFVNVGATHEIAVVDVPDRKVTKYFPLTDCEEPSGLALDELDHLLISVCMNGVAKFIDATSGHDVKTLRVGESPDAVIFDAARHLAFVPSAGPVALIAGDGRGTVSVIAVRSRADIALVDTIPAQGVHTGALDPQTGRLYFPTAKYKPSTPEFPVPSIVEGTFEILVVAPE